MTSTTLPGANPSAHSGATTAPDFGDIRAEFQALLLGCGLYDLSWRAKIAVTGGDRVRWLNGMVTNNVRDLALGHGVYAFMLNAQGHIQADLYVFQRGESLLVDTERGQRDKILQLFDRHIIADDVEIADLSGKLTALGLTGPESLLVRQSLVDGDDLSGKPRASRRRDAAAMVRRRHRANDPGPIRIVLAADAMGRQPQNHAEPAPSHSGVVSQERTHIQRHHRRRPQAILAHAEFINVPATPRQRGNSHRTLE